MNPDYLLSVGKASPTFPPGFSLRKTKLSLKINPDAGLFMADSIVIRPEIWSFLKGRSAYRFKCLAYGGDLKGSVHFSGNRRNPPFSASVKFKDIRIDNYTAVSSIAGSNMKGTLGGTIKCSGRFDSLINSAGEANLTIADGRFELLQPILSFESIDFDFIRMKMALNDGKIEVTQVELTGQEIAGRLSGSIFLKNELPESSLNLKGTLELLAGRVKGGKGVDHAERLLKIRSKRGKLNFTVGGTFSSPTFRLL
jgi:type II secretion system protein N